MERYSGDFLAAVDGLRTLLGCSGRVWPISTERSSLCAAYGDGSETRGEVEVDAGQLEAPIQRVWLDPPVSIHPAAAMAIRGMDAIAIGPGSFYTSLMPIFLARGVADALSAVKGPVILIANLLTEGRGMRQFTAAEGVRRISAAIGRPVDVLIFNTARPKPDVLSRYLVEHKEPLPLGDVPSGTEVVTGHFWSQDIARHDRKRLAYALWGVLARRLLDS